MIQIQKPKKKKAESTSQTVATAPNQNIALVPEQTPAAEEMRTQIPVAEEKKAESDRSTASMPPSQKPATPIGQTPPSEEARVAAVFYRKETSTEKAAAPCRATGGGEHPSHRTDVTFSGTILAITAPLPGST